MKLKLLILILGLLLMLPQATKGQETSSTTYLTIIAYESSNDHEILIENNIEIFEYLENSLPDTNVMLSITDDEGKATLLKNGYPVQVVEENPNMTNYVMLYSLQENQASELAYLGDVYALTPYHTLVRLDEGTAFDHTGPSSKFEQIPLQNVVPPGEQPPTASPTMTVGPEDRQHNFSIILPAIIAIILLIGIIVFIHIKGYSLIKRYSQHPD